MAKGEGVAKAAGKLAAAIVKDADKRSDPETEAASEDSSELANALNEVPEGVISVEVWQLLEGAEKAYAGRYDPEGFVDAVADRVGAGRYVAFFKKIGKDNKRVMAGKRIFTITPGLKPNPATAPAAGAGELGEVKKLMQSVSELIQGNVRQGLEQQQLVSTMQTAMLTKMMDVGKSQGPGLVEIITALGPIVAPLITALVTRGGGGMTPEFMLTLVDRMTKQVPAGSVEETLSLIERLKDMSGADGENAPPWLKSGEKLLGIVAHELEARRRPGGAPAAPAGVLMPTVTRTLAPAPTGDAPALAAAAPPPSEAAPVPAGASPLIGFVSQFIPMLVAHAELNHDPDTYAGFMLDQVSPGYHAALADMLTGDVLPEFVQAFPTIAPFQQWFGELLDAIRERLKPEEPEK